MRAGEFNTGEVVPGTRYRVVGLLGAGGMGLVYDVEHLELGKRFVLKALLSDLAGRDDIVARLRNEQRALGRLQHPNIIAVTDAGVTSTNIPFFVMERLDGETLGARLKRSRRLPVVEAIGIARGVLEGLSAAHEIGVVHRDIKPQNIFLLPGSRPKILDFGVAKIADAASVITARGVAIGTPRYMSPEQIGGERVDGRSDLYAVGLLLFETIAGRAAFDGVRDANEMLLAHLGTAAPRLAECAAGVTRELDALVASLLAKAPSDRPPTARAAVAALSAVLERYAGGSNLEAPTPLASYSATTHLLLRPSSGPSALVTRPDGVAARVPDTIVNPTGSGGTTQVILQAARVDATIGDAPRAVGGTLYDPSSRALTVAHAIAAMPVDAVRTERLETVALPVMPNDDPTHTRVPMTPSDATPSLVPVRVGRPRSQQGRPMLRFVAVVALLACSVTGYFLLRENPRSASRAEPPTPAAAPVPAVERERKGPHGASAESVASAPPTRREESAPTSSALLASSVETARVAARKAPTVAARPSTKSSNVAGAPGHAPSALSSRHSENRAPSAALPPGLPGSGL